MKQDHASIINLSGDGSPALMSVTAKGRLEGLLLSMTVTQVFKNNTPNNMEVVYTFPVAWGAVLLGLDAQLGNQRCTAKVIAKQQAADDYEAAVEAGDAPIMVEKNRDGSYTASLGSLKPSEEAALNIRYAQLLNLDHGLVRLTIPTTIGPRYGDPTNQGGLGLNQVPNSDLLVEYPFSLSIDITGEMAQARIASPSHTVGIQSNQNGVCVSLNRFAMLDRDFVLLLQDIPVTSWALSARDDRSGVGHSATLLSYCPTITGTASTPLNVKILVDCSGSMTGDRIEQARLALVGLTKLLNEHDRFSLTLFGTEHEHVITPIIADRIGLRRLDIALRGMNADRGGTEMHASVQATFNLAFDTSTDHAEADVLLITDGDVWEAQALVDAAKVSGHRVYAMGVGSAPNTSMLAELALATGGAYELIMDGEDMAHAVHRMVQRMRLALPVKAEWRVPNGALWRSPAPKRIANGETVHLFVRTDHALTTAPTLVLNGQEAESPPLQMCASDVIPRLLAASQASVAVDVETAQALAERYALVTDHTNLLLVIERGADDKTDGLPQLNRVAHMMPAGHSGVGRMRFGIDRQYANRYGAFGSQGVNPLRPAAFVNPVLRTHRHSVPFKPADMADLDPPNFLKKQNIETPSPRQVLARAIVQAFQGALDAGHAYQQAIRVVANTSFDMPLEQAVAAAKPYVGSSLQAWTCLLLWASDNAGYTFGLSDDTRMLLLAQLGSVSPAEQNKTCAAIDAFFVNKSTNAPLPT